VGWAEKKLCTGMGWILQRVFERFAEMDRFCEEREAKRAERMAKIVAKSENPQLLYEMGLIPQALFLETKPVADKADEKPKERFLKRRD